MNHLFKRTLSLLLALAMIVSMVPGFGIHAHAEELDHEGHDHATEAAVEVVETEPAQTPAPTEAVETEAPVVTTEATVETEAPVVEEPAETEAPAVETEAVEETTEATEEMIVASAEAMMATTLTTSVNGLAVSWDYVENNGGSVTWTPNGNSIVASAKGAMTKTNTTQLTLTNTSGSEATLKFSWQLTGGVVDNYGEVTVGNTTVTEAMAEEEKFESTLQNGDSVTVTLKSPRANKTNTLNITNISLVSTTASDAIATFNVANGGTYTVNGETIDVATKKTSIAGTEYALVASPASGYQFFGWYDAAGNCVSQNASYTLTVAADVTITPKFISDSVALFGVGTVKYDNLNEAGAAAAAGDIKTIVLLNNGSVSGNHTIPAGTTLLIPYNDANTVHGAEASCTSTSGNNVAWVKPTAYRTLTLDAGANITVNGVVEVSGQHAAAAGSPGKYGGSPSGPLGFIKMESGSHIDLNSGATLYCWGYIYGEGDITAKSGANVYENFQVMDFRGGSITMDMALTKKLVFPLSQYYVQNVEVATKFEYGSSEYIYTSMYISGSPLGGAVKFIGSGAMFQPASGSYIIKKYDSAADELKVEAYGDCALASMSIDMGYSVDSQNYVLPITNNLQISVKSGTATLKQNIMMLPGSSLTVDEGATLNIAKSDLTNDVVTEGSYVLQAFDSENWTYGLDMDSLATVTGVGYVHVSKQLSPVEYSPTKTKNRTSADLTDVTIDINGTVVTNGYLYSTVTYDEDFEEIVSGGANIISSKKTGTVAMTSGAGADMLTVLYDQAKNEYYYVPLASAQLKNGDGTYVNTTGAAAGTTYNYCASHDGWYTGDTCEFCVEYTVTYVDENGNTLGTETVLSGKTPKCEVAIPDKASTAQYTYTAAGWDYTGDGVADTPAAVTANITYKAAYTATLRTYDVVFYDTNGTTVLYTAKAVAYGSKPIYEGEMEKWEGTCVKYSINVPTVSEVDGTAATLSYTVSWTTEGAHNWTPATCTDPKTCSVCGTTEGEAPGHLWVEVTEAAVASTCVTNGSKTYFCTGCETTKTEEQPLNPGNHTGNNTIKDAKEASCTAEGYTGDTVCECGETVEKGVTIPAKGHLDDDRDHICNNGCGVYQGEHKDSPDDTDHICDYCHDETDVLEACSGGTADCTNKANCKVCGKEYGELNEDNHNWSDPVYDNNDGETHTKNYFCLNNSDHTKSDPPAPHVYVNGECECGKDQSFTVTFDYNGGDWSGMTQNETWTLYYGTTLVPEYNGDADKYDWRADMQKQYCTFVGWKASTDGKVYDPEKDSYTVTADVTFTAQWTHKCELVPVEKVDATCMAEGNSAYWYCADETCGKLYENADGTVETTLGKVTIAKDSGNHTGNNTYAVNAKEASCTEAGYTGDTVCECGETVQKGATISAKGHSFTAYAYNEDATCTADGTETAECDNDCGETKTQTAEGTKLGHDMQESEPQVDATCETDGKTAVLTCDNGCGHTEGGEVIPATGHGTEEGFRYEENNDELNTHDKICGDCNEPVETAVSCTYGDDHICDFCGETQSMVVIFMKDEETVHVETSVPYGGALGIVGMPLPTAPEGHEFAGWFTKDGTEIVNQMTVTTDLTGYAKWTPKEFNVTVKSPAGQENLILSSNTTATYGQDFTTTLSLTEAFEHGATSIALSGFWQGENKITGEVIGAMDYDWTTGKLTIPAKYITADIKIEAVAQVRLVYKLNGGAQSEDVNVILDSYATYGATIGLFPAECYVWENHTPVSYNTKADGSGTTYALGGEFTANEDTTLYVIWQANSDVPVEYEGWTQIDGDWYYYDTETKQPVTGVVRVPYPTGKINGITYEANESGIAHANKNGYTYADLETALFVFGADGKFDTRDQMVQNGNVTSWSSDGMLDWRPGLVEVNGDYYYFEEDKTNGGNRMVIGDTYLRANDTDLDLTYRGIYTFGEDGKICEYNGIVEMADGTLRYYEAWELMIGAGLVKVGDNYIYVRSNGELAVSTEYWVSDVNGYDIAVGMYDFDENGFLVFADQTKNGIYAENGGLYLYKDGEKVYEGLICYTGPSDNGVTYNNAWIYVRTNGQLATGRYWATKVDNAEGKTAGFYNFDANGIMDADKNGIVNENGTKYYYIKNERQYNLGVIELGGNYYYVRSNGEVVFGRSYWITNVGNSGIVPKLYTFDANGVMQNPEFTTSEGIVKGEEKGIWYYYVNGSIAYGAGVVYLEDEGCYIYVRSNGQLATGDYWPTTLNGELEPGMYNWGEDGKLYL